MLLYLRN